MTPCLDGETLAAWSAGTLQPAEAGRVEAHLADCARCQAMLAAFVRAEPVRAPQPAWWQRWQVRWLVPIATAATVAAIWIATPEQNLSVRQAIEPRMTAPPATPAPQAAPAETRQTFSNAPAAVGAATGTRKEAAIDQLQRRDLQANAPSAREEALKITPPPLPAPAPQAAAPAPQAAAAPPPAAERTPHALQERVGAVADSAVAQRRLGVEAISPDGTVRWRIVKGQLEKSVDKGSKWEKVAVPEGVVPATIVAVDAQQATVTTADGKTIATMDGGKTWTRR